jgi:hypothetical protein
MYRTEHLPSSSEFASPNRTMLTDLVALAIKDEVAGLNIIAGPKLYGEPDNRPSRGTLLGSVLVLRPALHADRYHKPLPGYACTETGDIYAFVPGENGSLVSHGGVINPDTIDEIWLAQAALITEANMEHPNFAAWASQRQHSGVIA